METCNLINQKGANTVLNQIQENPFVINAPVSKAYEAGDVVIEFNIVGVAIAGGPAGPKLAVLLAGIVELAADNAIAFSFGQALYWDETNLKLTTVSTSNTFIGTCALAKASTLDNAHVLLNGAKAP